MNASPVVPVDFGNCDEDGAVRLVTRGTSDYLQSHGIVLAQGLSIVMSDGELTAEGICVRRQEMWVALVNRWLT